MSTTGTVIVSALVGAAIGYGIAQLTRHPAPPHRIVVIPGTTPQDLGVIYVCKQAAHGVVWASTAGNVKVEWTGPAPHPYALSSGCTNGTSSSCDSGPLLSTAVAGSDNPFVVKIGSGTWNGRIIIDK